MILININKIFRDAVYERKVDTLEKILASSDSRVDLLEEFIKNDDINLLINEVKKFKSKGLISNIEDSCHLIESRFTNKNDLDSNFTPSIIKCIHYKNKELNKIKYLKEDTFAKNKAKNL